MNPFYCYSCHAVDLQSIINVLTKKVHILNINFVQQKKVLLLKGLTEWKEYFKQIKLFTCVVRFNLGEGEGEGVGNVRCVYIMRVSIGKKLTPKPYLDPKPLIFYLTNIPRFGILNVPFTSIKQQMKTTVTLRMDHHVKWNLISFSLNYFNQRF